MSTAGPELSRGQRLVAAVCLPGLRGNAGLYVGLLLVVLIAGPGLLATWLAPYDPLAQNLQGTLGSPLSSDGAGFHLLGTDELGRDVFSRVLHGARLPMLVGSLAVLLGGVTGVLAGAVAGYFGGAVDSILSRIADIQLSVPAILVALGLLAFAGQSVTMLVLVIALTGWPTYFRLIRVQAMSLAARGFVEASVSAGARSPWIIRRHILPNVLSLTAVVAALDFSRAILMEAGLSYLGLGVQPPTPDWGVMVSGGQARIADAWWIAACPGIAVLFLVLGVNMIGDWLADRRVRDAAGIAVEVAQL